MDHRGGEKLCLSHKFAANCSGDELCLSHKFAANCSGDDRYGIELEIAAIDVIPSGF